jgi:hypothetical protein
MHISTAKRRLPLEVLRVANPCQAAWDAMAGDEESRFCGHCGKHVHNLSAMPREQAERLICEAAGPLCVRYGVDAAGRVMTLDYQPASKRRRTRWWPLWLGSAAATIGAALCAWGLTRRPPPAPTVMGMMPPVNSTGGTGGAAAAPCQYRMGETAASAQK